MRRLGSADFSSVKETRRLYELSKSRGDFPKLPKEKIRLHTPDSVSEYDSDVESEDVGESSGTSGFQESDLGDLGDESRAPRKRRKAEDEAEYELSGRSRWVPASPKPEEGEEVGRLPRKLQNGEVQQVEGTTRLPLRMRKVVVESETEEEEEEEEEEEKGSDDGADAERMAGQKGRFGRLGVGEIVGMKSGRLELAKEQIAAVGAEVLAGGELVDIVSEAKDEAEAGATSHPLIYVRSPNGTGGGCSIARSVFCPRPRLSVATRGVQGSDSRVPDTTAHGVGRGGEGARGGEAFA